MKKYLPRIADALLARKLATMGGVLIQGPKWCGKTTTASQQAESAIFMGDPANLELAAVDYQRVLQGATPRLVDEWQVIPTLWDAARHMIDQRGEPGQFIFTGSAVPADRSQIHHSGAGRFAWLTMHTMSLFESGDSEGSVSLQNLFKGENPDGGECNIDVERLALLICRGGWPAITAIRQEEFTLDLAKNYVDAIVGTDISRVDGVTRSPMRTLRILRSLARHQGAQVSISTIRDDIAVNEADTISADTVASYLGALAAIFVTEDSPAWNPNIRSKTAIRTADTRYFSDPSIGAAVLGVGPNDLVNDLNTLGLMFETLAVRDLRVYASALDGAVAHYRDKTGLECDAVVHLRNGHYGLIEVKLGGPKNIDYGAETLKKLAARIDTDRMPEPSFMMVLTGVGRFAYRRDDGVLVVPIGTLRN